MCDWSKNSKNYSTKSLETLLSAGHIVRKVPNKAWRGFEVIFLFWRNLQSRQLFFYYVAAAFPSRTVH